MRVSDARIKYNRLKWFNFLAIFAIICAVCKQVQDSVLLSVREISDRHLAPGVQDTRGQVFSVLSGHLLGGTSPNVSSAPSQYMFCLFYSCLLGLFVLYRSLFVFSPYINRKFVSNRTTSPAPVATWRWGCSFASVKIKSWLRP